MHDHTGTTQLQARAYTLWTYSADQDTASICYAEAERHVANNEPPVQPGEPRRAMNWILALQRYEQFWRVHGRTARENTRNRLDLPAVERRLGEWARYQRRFDDKLCSYQRIRLDLSPAFEWDPHESVWRERRDDCVRHVRATGRLPYLNQADPVEFALARWMGRQSRRLQNGTLHQDRVDPFTALLRLPTE
jgi:hypothetical protein